MTEATALHAGLRTREPLAGQHPDGTPYRARIVLRDDVPAALALAGLDGQVAVNDAFAAIYPDRAYFDVSSARDRELGNTVHGPYDVPGGLLGVVDVSPQEARMRAERAAAP